MAAQAAYPFYEGRGLLSPKEADERIMLEMIRNLPNEASMTIVGDIKSPQFRCQAIESMIERCSESIVSQELFEILWPLAMEIELSDDRATALTATALAAPIERRLDSLQTAWDVAVDASYNDPIKGIGRAKNLRSLAAALNELQISSDAIRMLWLDSISIMMSRSREDFLVDLGASADIVVAMGGEQSARSVCDAIESVGRWLP